MDHGQHQMAELDQRTLLARSFLMADEVKSLLAVATTRRQAAGRVCAAPICS